MAITPKGPMGGAGAFPIELKIVNPPTKTNYIAGEQTDMSGIKVIAVYSNQKEEDVTSQCTFDPTPGSVVYENTKAVRVNWTWEKLVKYSALQLISVQRVLKSIAITKEPTKKQYFKGENLSLEGIEVTATFTSGNTEVVTGSCTFAPQSGAQLNNYGDVAVKATFSENGVAKTANTSVNVTVKIVTFATGTDEEVVNMIEASRAGVIDAKDYWSVGDERKVTLSAMPSTGVGESHAEQTVTLVILNEGGKTFADGTPCDFIVGLKNGLKEYGYMNSGATNSGGWKNSQRRGWCNGIFKESLPKALIGMFKEFKNLSGKGGGSSSGVEETADIFALTAEIEVFGTTTFSVSGEGSQFEFYKTTSNRIKKVGDSGSANYWWERSPRSGNSSLFCSVNSSGNAYWGSADSTRLLAPFGCI